MAYEAILKSLDRVESNLTDFRATQSELADRVACLEQRSVMRAEPSTGKAETFGTQVVSAFAANRDLFEKTRTVRLHVKAASDPVTTSSGRKILGAGVGAPVGGVLGLQNALPTRNASATSADYSRYTGVEGAAAVQAAEGDAKAPVRPTHTLVTQPAITIAGYTKMSRQAINDSDELRRAVDTTLSRSVATALDTALVDGVLTPSFSGFGALATAYTSLAYSTIPDAVSEAVATMQTAGFAPDYVALNPSDWLAVSVAKGTANDHYLSGSYLGVLPLEMRGLRVVLSPSIDAGTALVMDSHHSELLVVDGFAVEMAYSGDDFTKNLITLLGEVRVIPVFRTMGSARLITPAA